jgi:hypothetical protein
MGCPQSPPLQHQKLNERSRVKLNAEQEEVLLGILRDLEKEFDQPPTILKVSQRLARDKGDW